MIINEAIDSKLLEKYHRIELATRTECYSCPDYSVVGGCQTTTGCSLRKISGIVFEKENK